MYQYAYAFVCVPDVDPRSRDSGNPRAPMTSSAAAGTVLRLVPGDESDAIAQVVDPIAGPSCTQIVRGETWRDISLAKLSQKYLDRLDHLDRA